MCLRPVCFGKYNYVIVVPNFWISKETFPPMFRGSGIANHSSSKGAWHGGTCLYTQHLRGRAGISEFMARLGYVSKLKDHQGYLERESLKNKK